MTAIRVLLVDDHAVVTDGLRSLLSLFDDIDVVGAAQTGAAAIALCASVQPDVVLMDLSMPDMDGAETTSRILTNNLGVRVIALTGYLDEGLVRAVIDAGASGYLLKTVSGDDIVEAIRGVVKGRATMSLEALTHATRPEPSPETDYQPSLTDREMAVLQRVAEGETNKEIARHLSVSPGTVRVHVSNILAKFGVENRTAAVRYALRHDLLTDQVD
ncbi:MAG: response regulator transcription factor [Acidimicrobiia bacterium]|nr:response regulator transcription factor [Acidimicrobiia bacterium]